MGFIPAISETLVLPISDKEAKYKIIEVLKSISPSLKKDENRDSNHLFNGSFEDMSFKISRKVDHPQNFLPIVSGKIETTSTGCIVFLDYNLFFSTNLFLIFWSVMTVLFSLLFFFVYQIYLYALISLSVGVLNYIIALVNFNIQVKKSQKLLYGVFGDI